MLEIFSQKIVQVRSALGKMMRASRFFAFAAVPLALLLFIPFEAHAGALSVIGSVIGGVLKGAGETAAQLIMWIVIIWSIVHFLLYGLAFSIFLWLINFLIGVSQYNSFLGAPIVTIGWAVTRDIANMFLVVALLVIAFGVIFDSHHYQAQKMLKDFFIAAILVNFSKMICGVILDAAQVVMMTFVSGFSDTAAGNFVKMFQVGKFVQLAASNAGIINQVSVDSLADQSSNLFSTITNEFFSFILIFFGVVAVLSMLAVLVGRILTLWFLIMVSPLAFVLKVLPITSKYSGKWWHAFEQQVIAGPIVAFIIWVSLASTAVSEKAFDLTIQAQQGAQLFAETANSSQQAVAGTAISTWSNLALYFVPVALFILGAQWAVKVSGGIAASISKMTAGTLEKYGRKGLGAVGRDFGRVFTGESRVLSGANRVIQPVGRTVQTFGEKQGIKSLQYVGRGIAAGSEFALEAGAARQRARVKEIKKVGTKLGIGKEAAENYETAKAEADANLVEQRASKKLIQSQKAAENIKMEADRAASMGEITGAERQQLYQRADNLIGESQQEMTAARKRAGEIRGTRVEDVKKKIKAQGITEPNMIIAKLQERMQAGEKIPQVEIDAMKALHSQALKDERQRKIDEAEAKGLIPNQEARAALNKQIGDEQKASVDIMNSVVSTLTGTRLPADTDAEKRRQSEFDKRTTKNSSVRAAATAAENVMAGVRASGKTVAEMDNFDDIENIAREIGTKLVNINNPDGTPNVDRRREALSEAFRHVPASLRERVRGELRSGKTYPRLDAAGKALTRPDPTTGAPVPVPDEPVDPPGGPSLVTAPTGGGFDYDDIDVTYRVDAMAARAARGTSGPYAGKFNETDLRLTQNPKGQFEFKNPKDARVLEATVRERPEFVAEINPEALQNFEVQQAIGKAISSPDQLRSIRDQLMNDRSYNQNMVVDIMRGLKDAVVRHAESEPIKREVANAIIFDEDERDVRDILSDVARKDVRDINMRDVAGATRTDTGPTRGNTI